MLFFTIVTWRFTITIQDFIIVIQQLIIVTFDKNKRSIFDTLLPYFGGIFKLSA